MWSTKFVQHILCCSSQNSRTFPRYLYFHNCRGLIRLEFAEGLQPGIEVASTMLLKLGVTKISMKNETC